MATLLFDADVAHHGLAKYEEIVHEERITAVPDPILGAGRRVLKYDVYDTDIGPTVHPRAQTCSSRIIRPGMDIWVGWCTLFPTGFPEALPDSKWAFLTLAEVYGPPHGGVSPFRVAMRPGTPGLSALAGFDSVSDFAPILHNTWYDFALHQHMSEDPAEGFVELRVNTGAGWSTVVKQHMATMTANNNTGLNYHKVANYRYAGMYDRLALYHGEHRIGYSFSEVDPHSHG